MSFNFLLIAKNCRFKELCGVWEKRGKIVILPNLSCSKQDETGRNYSGTRPVKGMNAL